MKAKQFKQIREKAGLTQAELAQLIGYKSYHSISEMESGRRRINKMVEMVMSQLKPIK